MGGRLPSGREQLAYADVYLVCETPIVSSRAVEVRLGVTRPTALDLLRQLEHVGVLHEGTAGPRGQRRYLARELVAAVADDTADTHTEGQGN